MDVEKGIKKVKKKAKASIKADLSAIAAKKKGNMKKAIRKHTKALKKKASMDKALSKLNVKETKTSLTGVKKQISNLAGGYKNQNRMK